MTTYTQQEIEMVRAMVSENPRGFQHLVKTLCQDVTVDEVRRSMRAWRINPNKGHHPAHVPVNDKHSNHRRTRRRKNHRNKRVSVSN